MFPPLQPPVPIRPSSYGYLTLTYAVGDVTVSVGVGSHTLESIMETIRKLAPPEIAPLATAMGISQENLVRRLVAGLAKEAQRAMHEAPPNGGPVPFAKAKEVPTPHAE